LKISWRTQQIAVSAMWLTMSWSYSQTGVSTLPY